MKTYDATVAIVGAGPAGTAAAAHLGQLGVKNVVLLDKHDFPRDKTCGSGISPKGIDVLRELGVWEQVKPHAYKIQGIRLITPGGHESWQSGGEKLDAVVCHRRTLDHLILKRALVNGVTFVPNVSIDRLLEENGRVVGAAGKDVEVRARFTMVAGGTHCRLVPTQVPEHRSTLLERARQAAIRRITGRGTDRSHVEGRPREIIQAIMGWWDDVEFRPNHLEMIFDPDLAPYYGWLFPEGTGRVNIGITYEEKPGEKRNAREVFQRFLDKYYKERLAGKTQVGPWKGHPIAYSLDVGSLTSPGRIVVGEAGLLTHPATAEGIYQGMRSGMIAAESIHEILFSGASEERAFADYERKVRKAFQLSFLAGEAFRQAVKTPILDWLVKASETPTFQNVAGRLMANM